MGRSSCAGVGGEPSPAGGGCTRPTSAWLPKLSYPERTGVHSQTAFALGLMYDSSGQEPEFRALVARRIRDFYLNDVRCPVTYEPSGQDFLSPCIAEADAVRRVLPSAEFARWFDVFLPEVSLQPEKVTDPTDGQLAHLDGLNLVAGLDAGRESRLHYPRTTSGRRR